MKKLTVSRHKEEKIRQGALLLAKEDFPELSFDHQAVELVTSQGKFLGCGYISKQNKGLGPLIEIFLYLCLRMLKVSDIFISRQRISQPTASLIRKVMVLLD